MELSRVDISNFRSIKELSICFKPQCRILVGVNESGKTNILDALSFLSKTLMPSDEDRRDPQPDESPVVSAYVRFVFKLDKKECQKNFDAIKDQVAAIDFGEAILSYNKRDLTLQEFCNTRNEGLYRINIIKKDKISSFWSLGEGYSVYEYWKKPSVACPTDYIVKEHQKPLSKYKLINTRDFSEIPSQYLETISPEEINSIIGKLVTSTIDEKLPECVRWSYNESNLLPGRIVLANFVADPSSCLPLKHMFELAGYFDIKDTITAEQKRTNGIRNLLNRVADRATKHIRNVWKENKEIKIFLQENGLDIDAGIEDKFNTYNFAKRSDGFRRFVTFLLIISAKERTQQFKNILLLIDEPDIGLHPSGARYLKDELIKIAETNTVVFSTHSIFMVDRETVERHLIVKKENEVTTAEEASQSNIKDEEVIYNALGYSIFENLHKKNIVFEGWRDKKMFEIAIKNPPTKYKKLKEKFKDFGTCHAEGVKDIPRITAILNLANRECIILSDNDAAAKEQQKKYTGYGKWFIYSDILEVENIITGEDFVKPEVFKGIIKNLIQQQPELPALTEDQLNNSGGKIHALESWLSRANVPQQEKKVILNQIKEAVFTNLKVTQIEEVYFEYLEKITKNDF